MAIGLVLLLLLQARDDLSKAREQMVAEIQAQGVHDNSVLQAMRSTPRHLFVPAALESQAYADRPLPIGHSATISEPYIVALMTELLGAAKTDRILEIGTGSGYQAAVLSRLAREICTIEIVPQLAQSATKRLAELGYRNVVVRQGDGYQGWKEKAPFDRIILTAAPEAVPKTLLDQLARGGRLVAPVGANVPQLLKVIDKTRTGELRERSVTAVAFVPMVHK